MPNSKTQQQTFKINNIYIGVAFHLEKNLWSNYQTNNVDNKAVLIPLRSQKCSLNCQRCRCNETVDPFSGKHLFSTCPVLQLSSRNTFLRQSQCPGCWLWVTHVSRTASLNIFRSLVALVQLYSSFLESKGFADLKLRLNCCSLIVCL